MKTLYIECGMGAAGDMLMAALSELLPDPDAFVAQMNALGLPGVRVERQRSVKCGITGTHMAVTVHGEEEHEHPHDHEHHEHEHHHHHSHPSDIRALIDGMALPENVKQNARRVYDLIAKAESEVHGEPVEHIHFHEVGALDAVADVTGVCLLMDMIGPDRVVVSPVHVGSGTVHCAHGVLPVPAPATARLLTGVPIYSTDVRGELCTPTGAALLKTFADSFGPMPAMTVEKLGYGMGTKDFERANCVRVMLGDTADAPDAVTELSCNLDDMTGEALAFAAERLLEAGALDVWFQSIQMKKGRPGVMLCCLCRPDEASRFADLMFKHTTTLGVRFHTLDRFTLDRRELTRQTPWGPVRVKRAAGHGATREKPEFDDLSQIARRENLSVVDVLNGIQKPSPLGKVAPAQAGDERGLPVVTPPSDAKAE